MQSAVSTREYAVSGPDLSGIAPIWTYETHTAAGKTVGRTECEDSDARQGQVRQRSPRTRFESLPESEAQAPHIPIDLASRFSRID